MWSLCALKLSMVTWDMWSLIYSRSYGNGGSELSSVTEIASYSLVSFVCFAFWRVHAVTHVLCDSNLKSCYEHIWKIMFGWVRDESIWLVFCYVLNKRWTSTSRFSLDLNAIAIFLSLGTPRCPITTFADRSVYGLVILVSARFDTCSSLAWT